MPGFHKAGRAKCRRDIDEHGSFLIVTCSNGIDEFYIDEEDWPIVADRRWTLAKMSNTTRYVVGRPFVKNGSTLLHRQIMGEPKGYQIDHEDGNGRNCRHYNMRICHELVNKLNVVNRAKVSSSGFRGVYPSGNGYNAILYIKDKPHYVGWFRDPVEAAKAWDEKAREVRGRFTQLNFPSTSE